MKMNNMIDVTAETLSQDLTLSRGIPCAGWSRTKFYAEEVKKFYRSFDYRRIPVIVTEGKDLVECMPAAGLAEACEVTDYYGMNFRLALKKRILLEAPVLTVELVRPCKAAA